MHVAMEDAHIALLNLEEDSPDPNTFFAVYDGHGGTFPPTLLTSLPFLKFTR